MNLERRFRGASQHVFNSGNAENVRNLVWIRDGGHGPMYYGSPAEFCRRE